MTSSVPSLFLLKHHRLWQELDEDARLRLEAAGRRECHPRGSILWGPDDERGEAQLVLEGRVRVFAFDPLGREIVLGILEEGELAAQVESSDARTGYVEALEACEILRLRLAELQGILEGEMTEAAQALERARKGGASRG